MQKTVFIFDAEDAIVIAKIDAASCKTWPASISAGIISSAAHTRDARSCA
jgi:hypothetical protein